MAEISTPMPIHGGMSYDRLEAGDEHGLQRPCWDEDHDGTPSLYDDEGGSCNSDHGLVRFVPAEGGTPGQPPDDRCGTGRRGRRPRQGRVTPRRRRR